MWFLVLAFLGICIALYLLVTLPWVTFFIHHWYLALVFLGLLYVVSFISQRWQEFKR